MYYPVPGHTHIQVLLPGEKTPTAPVALGKPPGKEVPFSPLIRTALDATFGVKDIQALQKRAFAPIVRSYVRARRIGGLPTGTVRVASTARKGQEFYGTAISAGSRYAWVARVKADQLVSFRVL